MLRDCARPASVAVNQQMRVQFPPLPPSSPGRPLRFVNQRRALSEKPDTRAPGAHCDRGRMAQAADCGSVHEGSIPSGHPMYAGVVQRKEHFGPNEETPVQLRPPVPDFVGVAQSDESAGFRSPRPLVRFHRSLQIFDIRGLGKRINPLGLGPRDSRFKSEVPDQFLWGSQVVRRLAVTQFMRRFESCPHSQMPGSLSG